MQAEIVERKDTAVVKLGQAIATLDARLSTRIAILEEDMKEQKQQMERMHAVAAVVAKLEREKADVAALEELKFKVANDIPSMPQYAAFKYTTEFEIQNCQTHAEFLRNRLKEIEIEQTDLDADQTRRIKELEQRIAAHHAELQTVSGKTENNIQELAKVDGVLATKALKTVTDDLIVKFDQFGEVSHNQQLRDVFLPKLNKFTQIAQQLENSNDEVREIVAKFDYNLSLKCNKSAMFEMAKNFEKTYIPRTEWGYMENRLQDFKDDYQQYDDKMSIAIDRHKAHIDGIVGRSILKQLEERLSQYEDVRTQFEQFFNQDELGSLIDRKADLELVRRVQRMKIDKADFRKFEQ